MEAVILSCAGAVVGMLLGKIVLLVMQIIYPGFSLFLPTWVIWAALAVALLTALVFGVLPARKAADIDPVAALNKR